MCPRTDLILEGKFWDIGEFDLDLYKNIVEDGIKYGMCSLKYNILGEPLLHPKLLEMIRFAKKIGVVDTMLNTNGSLLTPQLSRGVVNSGLDKLFFSFDSPNKEVYNKIRVGADYDKVLNKIRSFMKIRNSMESITPLTRASMVVMKENEHEVEDFSILFSSIVDVVAYSIYLKHTGQELSEDKTAVQLHKDGKFCCPQLWQRMFVHTDGEVAVCCIDTARTIKIGNIFETTIRELWLGKEYQEVRKLHSSGKYDSIPTCRKCPLAQY
jgi:radical SAM protein with 4Fe4S-binding SPASM domain